MDNHCTYIWIKQPSTTPICHCCPNLLFPSWDSAIEHTMANHKIFDPYTIYEVISKDVRGSIPEIRKKFQYTCFLCKQPRLFQSDSILRNHMKRNHGVSEINAFTLANVQRNLSIFDEVKKEVIEKTNSKV